MKTNTRELFRKYTDPKEFDRIVEYQTVSEMWEHCLSEFHYAEAIQDN